MTCADDTNGILASKCWLTAVFVGERPQITIVCTDLHKILYALPFWKRNLLRWLTCQSANVYAFANGLFLDRKTFYI